MVAVTVPLLKKDLDDFNYCLIFKNTNSRSKKSGTSISYGDSKRNEGLSLRQTV